MKYKLSKLAWESIGKIAGWVNNDNQLEENLELSFANAHKDFSFHYYGENNEGSVGTMSMNIINVISWLKRHLSSEAFEVFLGLNMDSNDVKLQRNIEGLFNSLSSEY
jgi:hypothetical protein